MKLKKIALVTCLLLAILTMGAVSASDDINETLTVDDIQEESLDAPGEEIIEYDDGDDVLSYETDDLPVEAGEPISADDFDIHYDNNITNLDDFLIWMDSCPVNGMITFVINGTSYPEYMAAGEGMWITPFDFELTEPGTYFIAVKFQPTGGDELTLIEFDFNNGMDPNSTVLMGIYDKIVVNVHNNMLAYVLDTDSLVGTVTLYIDGSVYYRKSFDGYDDVLYISDMNLNYDIYMKMVGNHTVKVEYNNITKESTVSFGFDPFILKPDAVAAGETSYIIFKAPGSFVGNVTLYDAVYNNLTGKYDPTSWILKDYPFSDSASEVPLPNLTEGSHAFYANYTINGKNYGELFTVNARENSEGFTSSISSTEVKKGNPITLAVTVPAEGLISFNLDGKFDGSEISEGNVTSEHIFSGMAIGKHVLTVSYDSNGNFYYKAYLVEVISSSKATVVDNTTDASTTSIYAQLILTDTATGEVFIKNITVGPISSVYSNASNTNVTNNITETINQLLSIARAHAGDNAVTIKSQNVSNPYPARFDNRTYTWFDNGLGGRALLVNGSYGTIWSYNLTVTAEYVGGIVNITDAEVVLSAASFTFNGKVQKPTVKTIAGKALVEGTDYNVTWSNPSSKNAGTYTITITGKGSYDGTTSAKYVINKAANPLTVKAKTAKVKYSALKKKAQTLAVTKVVTFTKKGQGTMTYAKASGNKKITINKKTGKVTVKKGLKKGTYKVKIKIKAAGNSNYKASAYKTVTFKIIVK